MSARSRGAVLLARVGQTQEEVAARLKVSRVAVSHWLNGTTKPTRRKREIFLAQYGIPLTSWDEPPSTVESTVPRPRPVAEPDATMAPIPEGVIAKARALEQMAHELMQGLRDDPSATPLEKAKVMNSVASTLALLARLTGQFDLGTRLLRLPMWKRIERALEDGLRGYPDAARSVELQLRALEEEFSQAS
jgi:transcriptional regulator with XRE-family HTH domain